MLMRPDDRAVDHHVFVVMVSGQITKDPFDNTAFTPPTKTPVYVFPVPETDREIAPWNASAIAIKDGLYEQTIVRSGASDIAFTTPGRRSFIRSHWSSRKP